MSKTPRYMTEEYISIAGISELEAAGELNPNNDLFLKFSTNNYQTIPVESVYMSTIYTLTPWQTNEIVVETNALCLVGANIDLAEGFDYHTFEPIMFRKGGIILEDLLAVAYENKDILHPDSALLCSTNSLRVRLVRRTVTMDGPNGMIILD